MHPLFQGMLLGLTLAALLGPALFTLLQTSIHRGARSGIFLAIGISLSDLAVVFLAFIGVLQLINQKQNYLIAGILGGAILIGFGIYTYYHKIQLDENNNALDIDAPGPITYIIKGFFLNIMNPFVWFFWITAMVGVSSNYGDDKKGLLLFFIGCLATILGTDILKVFIAQKLKRKLSPHMLTRVNHIVGILLVIFGVILIARVFLIH